jgi:two-component system, cell cycle response regulator DivK
MTRILLVEDEELNRDMLSRRLMRRGYEVLLAVDGLQAIRVALEQMPDLIVMDMRLPDLDGWQATRQLRDDPRTSSIPVLALTAHAMAGDRDKALEAGCVDYDTKPIELPRLIAKIEAIVNARSAGGSAATTASGTGESA